MPTDTTYDDAAIVGFGDGWPFLLKPACPVCLQAGRGYELRCTETDKVLVYRCPICGIDIMLRREIGDDNETQD